MMEEFVRGLTSGGVKTEDVKKYVMGCNTITESELEIYFIRLKSVLTRVHNEDRGFALNLILDKTKFGKDLAISGMEYLEYLDVYMGYLRSKLGVKLKDYNLTIDSRLEDIVAMMIILNGNKSIISTACDIYISLIFEVKDEDTESIKSLLEGLDELETCLESIKLREAKK